MGRRGAALVAVALSVAAIGLWRASRPAPETASPVAAPRAAPPDVASSAPPERASELPPLPPSLRGTTPPGGFRVGPDGHLRPGPHALVFFDAYLAASGEEPLEQIARRIRAGIRERLAEPAAGEAEALLERYLAYRDALAELDDPALAESADLERRVQWIRELRREHFGAETARALFADREKQERYALERQRLLEEPALDGGERAEALAELEPLLPEDVQRARARAGGPLALDREVALLRAEGASEGEVQALREEAYGPEAAQRLADADRQRRAWDERWQAYREARDTLLADPDARTGIEPLRRTHFHGPELARVRALDAVELGDRLP